MKDYEVIAAKHEINGTDPFDDPEFVAALEKSGDIPVGGSQWNPDWVNVILNEYHRNTITMLELRARLRANQMSEDGISALLADIDEGTSSNQTS